MRIIDAPALALLLWSACASLGGCSAPVLPYSNDAPPTRDRSADAPPAASAAAGGVTAPPGLSRVSATEPVPGDATITPLVIPVQINEQGAPFVSIAIGGHAHIDALLDTGSVGLWVAPNVLSPGDATLSSTALHTGYGGKLVVDGVLAQATVTLAEGVVTKTPIPIAVAQTTSCAAGQDCAALSDDTLIGFQAILGIGLRHPKTGLVSPIAAIANTQTHLVQLGRLGDQTGRIVVDPPTSDMLRFANVVRLPQDGNGGWDETQVPFCVNAFCGTGLLDSGISFGIFLPQNTDDLAELGVQAFAGIIPGGRELAFSFNGEPAFDTVVKAPPQSGVDRFKIQTTGVSNNLSVIAFRHVDVLYDATRGAIAIAPKAP